MHLDSVARATGNSRPRRPRRNGSSRRAPSAAPMPVALEVQHDVDQVLQRARARDGAVLGDVTDQDASRRRLRLASEVSAVVTARTCVTPPVTPSASGRDMRLHRVHHHQGGLDRLDVAEHGRAGRIRRPGTARRGCSRCVRRAAGPGRRTPRPTRTARGAPVRAQRCATSSSSVDLPTPGSPASSVTEPGTSPPPSTRSSSSTPVGSGAWCGRRSN